MGVDYLYELITKKHHAVRALHSNDKMLLDKSKISSKIYSPRAFIYATPYALNKLQSFFRKSFNLSTFKFSLNSFRSIHAFSQLPIFAINAFSHSPILTINASH